jgi:hypothetical protein
MCNLLCEARDNCCGLLRCQVQYLAKRLSTLLVMPDSRQALMRLPEPLLRQLLASEAVDVEQVGGTVHVCWPVGDTCWTSVFVLTGKCVRAGPVETGSGYRGCGCGN